MKNILPRWSFVVMSLQVLGCQSHTTKETESSAMKDFAIDKEDVLANVKDVPTALTEARQLGFVTDAGCGSGLKGGEEVMFSTAYDPQHESGQASGVLEKTELGIFFRLGVQQLGGTRSEPPGLGTFANQQLSSWEFGRYFQAICTTAFNLNSLLPTPLYTEARASIVDVSGGTAGLAYAHQGVLRLELSKVMENGERAGMTIYMKKGFGPVGLEIGWAGNKQSSGAFLQSSLSFRLFVNDQGGTGIGTARTDTKVEQEEAVIEAKRIEAAKEKCAKTPGATWVGSNCLSSKIESAKTADECWKTKSSSGKHVFSSTDGCFEIIE